MTKARDLANLISAGSPFADGLVAVADISDLTASAAELNTLDGVTASTSELNILDGVTASAAELNILDGDGASGWKVAVSGTDLLFKYNGTAKLKIESDGDVTAVGDVTAFGTL